MISAWKRFVSKNNGHDGIQQMHNHNGHMPNGVQKLDRNLQKKFARGVQYNMKIIIKGDQRVGKTCLFNRLKGEQFCDLYNPTEEIQATTIQWNYKATDDIVKIDIWEAIDSVKRKIKQTSDLKLENNNSNNNADTPSTIQEVNQAPINEPVGPAAEQVLDASIIDVYKNANAVLLVMDMTKSWTFKYVQNEIQKIPKHLPILIISNHRDMGHHRTITQDQVRTFIETLDRSSVSDGHILYSEASMKNGFGLRFIHKFFNIPFLRLQEVTLLKQLELNRIDLSVTQEELVAMNESEDQEYEKYLEMLTIIRRQQADMLSPASGAVSASNSAAKAAGKSVPLMANTTNPINLDNNLYANLNDRLDNNQIVFQRSPSIIIGANRPLPEKSILNKTKLTHTEQHSNNHSSTTTEHPHHNGDDQLTHQIDSKFNNDVSFNKSNSNKSDLKETDQNDDDSDDSDELATPNPLVANYQDELDPDDLCEGVETGQHMASK